jgi:LemA protein
MNKWLIGCGVAVALFLIGSCTIATTAIGINNNIVTKNQACDAGWSQVENVYQRRLDLIPNLVATVKGAAAHELDVQVKTVEQRASATKVTVNASNLDDLKKYQAAQGELSGALSRLMVVSEQYPQIKANENFLNLQTQIEGTENRVAVERKKFNDVVQDYNSYVVRFPASFVASFRGLQVRPFYKADEAAKFAPKVDFGKDATPVKAEK